VSENELKQKVIDAIDAGRDDILNVGEKVFCNPELGYRETETTRLAVDYLSSLKLEVETDIAVTGCRTYLNKNAKGPRVALLGELDAIVVKDHPRADESGNVHACGHNVQLAGLLGAVTGLVNSGVLAELGGSVSVMTTPAEEFIELESREKLRSEGKIRFFGGKQELIHKGFFDDVDMSVMFHSLDMNGKKALLGPESNGFIGKKVRFTGKESHAGSAPEKGVNALNAATLAIMNMQVQRETFRDEDRVRVHPIITKGGDIVNVVPGDVRMEAYVRARTIEGMKDANDKVNRALKAGAFAVGADIEITEIPGYLPILKYESMDSLYRENLKLLGCDISDIIEGGDFTGSFDFGDVSQLMPSLHPMMGGVEGAIHTRDFHITDPDAAYLLPAKAMALTVVDLLYNEAAKARDILKDFTPSMTKESYLALMEENTKVISEKYMI